MQHIVAQLATIEKGLKVVAFDFGDILSNYLRRSDRTASWLANQLGMSGSTVSRWLSGYTKPMNVEQVIKISALLNLSEKERRELLISAGHNYIELAQQNKSRFVELRDVLAALYPDLISARRIASDAGIGIHQISLNLPTEDMWNTILNEATKQGRTENLLNTVRHEYGSNETLLNVVDKYLQFPPQLSLFTLTDKEFLADKPLNKEPVSYEVYKRKPTMSVTIKIEEDIDSWSEKKQEELLDMISTILRLDGEINIRGGTTG